jgi:hypothetical protein
LGERRDDDIEAFTTDRPKQGSDAAINAVDAVPGRILESAGYGGGINIRKNDLARAPHCS